MTRTTLSTHLTLSFLMAMLLMISAPPLKAQDATDDSGEEWSDEWSDDAHDSTPLFPISGYFESTASYRTKHNNVIDNEWVAQDVRGRIQTYYSHHDIVASYKGEIYFDGITSEWHSLNREAYIGFTPTSSIDIRAGRQVLTWGTGDLLFLNDFFPKNWVALFSGYDQQYLKAPSDAVKISGYSDFVNIDLILSPQFDSDEFITGEKLSYYSPADKSIVAAPPTLRAKKPGTSSEDSEVALRIYKNTDGIEYAAYLYQGFYKTPEGYNIEMQTPYFPELQSIGASARTGAFNGIANIEYAYWNSAESNGGRNPYVPNDQSRFLMGYETEIVRNITASFQYYAEYTHDYEALVRSYPSPEDRPQQIRQVLTTRWSLNTQQSNLVYSAFLFYSTSDEDYYFIPNVMYRMNDSWQFNAGANLLGGKRQSTLFGQMEANSNIYLRAKFIF